MKERRLDKTTIERPEWLPLEVWPFQIRTIELDGDTIAYTDEGEGPLLLLVHDGMWSYVWGQLIARLRSEFRVVTLDFPGSGLSPDTDRPRSLEADSMLLERLVATLGLRDITLVLHDLGGGVGVGLAARRPETVNGMVLVNTFAWPPHAASMRTMFRIMTSTPMRALNVRTNLIPKLTSGRFGIGRHLDDRGRAGFLGGFGEKGPRHRFHDMLAAASEEIPYLAELENALDSTLSEKPALTIYGSNNDPFGFQAKFREYLHHPEEMVVPNGNHFPMCDDPDGVAARISVWHETNVSGDET